MFLTTTTREAAMTSYRHLTREQRYTLSKLYQAGHRKKMIATLLEVHPSTVTRELQRNRNEKLGIYDFRSAHCKYLRRRKKSGKPVKMRADMQKIVLDRLDLFWSPEQISGRLHQEGIAQISHQTIYNFLRKDRESGGCLYQKLRRKKHYRRRHTTERRGAIQDRRMITERPAVVEGRTRLGDWELDTVAGKKEKVALITAVERKTRYTVATRSPDRSRRQITKRLISSLSEIQCPIRTLTADNGIEFSGHKKIGKALRCDFFFALPHHPWERGTNENTNGLLRQYFPKGESLKNVTIKEVKQAVEALNNRPRKCLNFATPKECFERQIQEI